MSDDLLEAASAALGAPPEIVKRSAAARAAAEGVTVEEILATWAGGAPPPARPVAVERIVEEIPPEAETPEAPKPAAPLVPAAAGPVITQVVRAARPVSVAEMPAPLVVGRKESHGKMLTGAVALFLAGLLGSVVLPTFAVDREGTGVVRSELAEAGREIYVTEGCGYCHTQLVRPVVTDAHLGPVTESSEMGAELPSTAGWIRVGPDLADFADREDADPAILRGLLLNEADRPHQSYRYLSEPDLEALIAYLLSLE